MHPALVKHLVTPLHERLLGRKSFSSLKELEGQQYLSADELEALKHRKLKALLSHALENIPFYAKRFEEAGFHPSQLRSTEDIRKLPFLTKEDIRSNLDDMQWKNCPGGLFRYNTGGSSGSPLIFYFDRRRQAYDIAARAMTHRWWGCDIGSRELYLWGSPVEISKQDRLKSLRDALSNQLLLSAFELSEDSFPAMYEAFKRFKPDCVFGYPSTVELFCRMAEKAKAPLADFRVRAVFSTAEVLYDHQRAYISERFGGVPVTDCYGSREGGFISHECPAGTYHVMDPNYVLEYIVDDRAAEAGEEGEITITHLDAWGMPFIRYRSGDVSAAKAGACSCGRTWSSMEKIRGRTTDFIVTPDGRRQHALSLIYILRDIPGVREFKILQKTVEDVQVLLVQDPGQYPARGDESIREGFAKRMGASVVVDIKHVEEIPRDKSGKYRYVVSDVPAWDA
jgi:phenylacetate-CoA ligase